MAPPPPTNPILSTYHLCFLLLVSTAVPTYSSARPSLAPAPDVLTDAFPAYSRVCPSLAPAPDRPTDADDARSLTRFFQIENGHFSVDDVHLPATSYRSFSLFPRHVLRTTDPALVHLIAVVNVILIAPRSGDYTELPGSISFDLDGYYSFASLQLCMVGAGAEVAGFGRPKHYEDVALRLRIPSPLSLTDPFVTGSLDGASDFDPIQLLAYAGEGHDYKYGESAPCDPPVQLARGSLRALGGNYACTYLKERLVTTYRLLALDHHHGGSPAKLRRMHVSQMQCTEDGGLRAYMVLSNDTGHVRREKNQFYHLLAGEEALVADGHWDSARDMFYLRACRVVRSGSVPSTPAVRECGIGMSFWFPAAWTVLGRSVVSGVLWNWNSTQGQGTTGILDAGAMSGVMSAFSMDDQRRNLSDVKYKYNDTMLEVAKKHYLKINHEKKIKWSFPVPGKSTTHHDFLSLRFWMFGASINMVAVTGDDMMTTEVDTTMKDVHGTMSVSYDIHYHVPLGNSYSYGGPTEERRISAEGVYDPKRGILCMVGCEQRDGLTDCQMLITVQFASMEDRAGGLNGGSGAISSLRDRSDRLFFERRNITLYGMYTKQVSEAIWRMDLESVMLVASATLSCVFIIVQILRVKKNPEAAAATSITMVAILALGYLTPLVLNFDVIFLSRSSQYYLYSREGWLDLNQMMMKVPALIAFVLHLRLLELVVTSRLRSAGNDDESEPATSVSERTVLEICLPLYLLGGVLAAVVHMIKVDAASDGDSPTARTSRLCDDVVSYVGLMVDGFLLPQVILNASSLPGPKLGAISPWFYMGGTMIRAAPHVYDVVRRQIYMLSVSPSDIYASPRGDFFGVAWDTIILCGGWQKSRADGNMSTPATGERAQPPPA